MSRDIDFKQLVAVYKQLVISEISKCETMRDLANFFEKLEEFSKRVEQNVKEAMEDE